jgi:tetratricopeptide (TPR) repeat protein
MHRTVEACLGRLAPVSTTQPLPNPEAAAWHQRGRELQLQGDAAAAERAYRQALALDPLYRRSLNNLAVLLLQRFEPQQAEQLLERGLNGGGPTPTDPADTALLLNTLCQLRLQQQRPQEAVAVARRLVRLAPQASHFTNLAVALQLSGQPQAALRAQRQALGLGSVDPLQLLWQPLDDPQASAQRQRELQNLATMELALDPFGQQGWCLLQARLAAQPGHWARQPSPWQGLWGGEYAGELLLWDEQGFGDAIQCLRWLPAAARRVERLECWLRPQLLPLVQQRLPLPAHVELRAWPSGAEPWRQGKPHLPLMNLPLTLGLSGPALAAGLPLRHRQPERQPGPRRFGVVWAAGRKPEPEADRQARQRSVPLAELMAILAPMVRQGRLQLVSLQVGEDAQEAHAHPELLQPALPLADWEATSQQIERLDGVISVDTAVAHLAGSLGVPTLLMLNEPCDWRWGLEGERTPWYRNVRLLRGRTVAALLQRLQVALTL